MGLGNLEFDSGQWGHAIDYYSRALAIDGTNADVRVDRAIAYHSSGQNDIAKKENEDSIEAVRKSGKTQILTLTADEKAAWKKALTPVHTENEGRIGKDVIEAVYKETGFKR